MFTANLPLSVYAISQPKAIRDDALRVMISRDGSIFFRNIKIDPTELAPSIRQAVKEGAERKVYLTVDWRTKYADAKVVYDAISAGGVRDICLMAEKIDPHR